MQFTLCPFRLVETQKQDSDCKFFFLHNWKYKQTCGQNGGVFGWVLKADGPPFHPCQEHLSGLPQLCLINQLRRPVGFPAWRLPCQIAEQLWRERKKRILRLLCFSLCYHLSIRSLFCAQLVNLTECLSFSSQSRKSDLIRIAVLSAGAATNEALFWCITVRVNFVRSRR